MKISLLRTIKLSPAQKFEALRLEHCKSVEETAFQLKLPVASYMELENGDTYPTERMIRKIAKHYGLSYDGFLAVGETQIT